MYLFVLILTQNVQVGRSSTAHSFRSEGASFRLFGEMAAEETLKPVGARAISGPKICAAIM